MTTRRATRRAARQVDMIMYRGLVKLLWCIKTAAVPMSLGFENPFPLFSVGRSINVNERGFTDDRGGPIRQSLRVQWNMIGGCSFVASFVA